MTTQLISGGSDIGPENRPGASILELALQYSQTLSRYKERYCRMASCVLGVMNIEQPNPPNDVAEIDRVNAIYKDRGDLASMIEARLLDKAEQVESSRMNITNYLLYMSKLMYCEVWLVWAYLLKLMKKKIFGELNFVERSQKL